MRENKFRGKSIETGEMIYGSLINNMFFKSETKQPVTYIVDPHQWEDYSSFEDIEHLVLEVDPETVGQYTGLKDKNGKEIYEGDVVGCESNGVNRYEHRVVCYDSHQTKYKAVPLVAYLQNAGNGGWTGYDLKYHNEVIGNTYDNPELFTA